MMKFCYNFIINSLDPSTFDGYACFASTSKQSTDEIANEWLDLYYFLSLISRKKKTKIFRYEEILTSVILSSVSEVHRYDRLGLGKLHKSAQDRKQSMSLLDEAEFEKAESDRNPPLNVECV